ncbi:MAG: type II toxin-antitoxin system RelE/ParE family toxin [Deltaproteobacteria bacterium]|nr:type II toxin-antitoxin system RelE/ParE family toxin [Deltaproteobacteria bacterium]
MVSAAQEFRSLPLNIKQRVAKVIETIIKEPRPRGIRKMQGHDRLYRIRIGYYSLVYEIDDKKKIIKVTQVRHRRDAYR